MAREFLDRRRPIFWADENREYGISYIHNEAVLQSPQFQLQPSLLLNRHMLIIDYQFKNPRVTLEYLLSIRPNHNIYPSAGKFFRQHLYDRSCEYNIPQIAQRYDQNSFNLRLIDYHGLTSYLPRRTRHP